MYVLQGEDRGSSRVLSSLGSVHFYTSSTVESLGISQLILELVVRWKEEAEMDLT